MNKIKHLTEKLSKEIKELARKFPLTMGLVLFTTVLFTIVIDQHWSKSIVDLLDKISLFCIIWGVGTIFTETYFVKNPKNIISYGLTGGISCIFTQLLTSDMMRSTGEFLSVVRFLGAYIATLILISIYKTIQNANLKFEEYILKVFRDLFHMTVTYFILIIGSMILTSIFVQLILDGRYGSLIERLLTLLFGLFYVPAIIYSFSGISKKEVNSFIKGLVLYVLLPLVTIAMAIIYIYIAKIILLQNMPQNTIYRILAGIFIIAFPVWNMAKNYGEDKPLIGKITTRLPYFYTPFILLEIYSIGTRINEFGITPMRYISCIFIVFQAIGLGLTFYKKGQKISLLFLCAAVLVLVVMVTPFNYENVSNWSQKRILEKAIGEGVSFEELSQEEKKRVRSAYEYLKYESNEENAIPSYLTEDDKAKIEEFSSYYTSNYNEREYVSLACELQELNIEEYTKITYVRGDNDENSTMVQLRDLEKTVDLKDKVEEIISQNEKMDDELENNFEQNNIVKISDTEDLYLSSFVLNYYKNSKEINYLRIEGYLLER